MIENCNKTTFKDTYTSVLLVYTCLAASKPKPDCPILLYTLVPLWFEFSFPDTWQFSFRSHSVLSHLRSVSVLIQAIVSVLVGFQFSEEKKICLFNHEFYELLKLVNGYNSTLYNSNIMLSRDSCASSGHRWRKDLIASIASSALSNCFIAIVMSFKALSTRSPRFIEAQNMATALLGFLSTTCQEKNSKRPPN